MKYSIVCNFITNIVLIFRVMPEYLNTAIAGSIVLFIKHLVKGEQSALNGLCYVSTLRKIEIGPLTHDIRFSVKPGHFFRPEENGLFSKGVYYARLLELLEINSRRKCQGVDVAI